MLIHCWNLFKMRIYYCNQKKKVFFSPASHSFYSSSLFLIYIYINILCRIVRWHFVRCGKTENTNWIRIICQKHKRALRISLLAGKIFFFLLVTTTTIAVVVVVVAVVVLTTFIFYYYILFDPTVFGMCWTVENAIWMFRIVGNVCICIFGQHYFFDSHLGLHQNNTKHFIWYARDESK